MVNKKITVQFIKYFATALVGYLFDIGTLVIMRELLHLNYLISATGGFVVGLTVLYILTNKFVFSDSKIKSKTAEFGLFAIIGIVGLGILTLLMWLFVEFTGMNYLISKIIATVFVYIWNFTARRTLYHN